MKHTKLMILGLTAAMTIGAGTTVFADEIADTDQDTAVTAESSTQDAAQQKADRIRKAFRGMFGEKPEGELPEIDMSALELPEDFVPFDENHVPDGKNAPANGELRPVEFDADGNMTFGQKPEGMPPMQNGEMPPMMNGELPEGEQPAFDGEMPELPEGEMPPMMNGELPEGEQPVFNGEMPELPEGEMPPMTNGEMPQPNGEMPQFNGEMPELPEDGAQPAGFAQGGQGPVGQLTSFFGWR